MFRCLGNSLTRYECLMYDGHSILLNIEATPKMGLKSEHATRPICWSVSHRGDFSLP